MDPISVKTTPPYTIHIQPTLLAQLPTLLKPLFLGKRLGIITQPNLISSYATPLKNALIEAGWDVHVFTIPQGETTKSLDTIHSLLDQLIPLRFERIDGLLALGGGVVGDITGFLASIYLRGIKFAQIPTTLLAQVDAAIGGKTGVNHPLGKNLIGTFYQPQLVAIDPETLRTLPAVEWKSGLAEILKYGFIQNPDIIAILQNHLETISKFDYDTNPHLWETLIYLSAECKAKVVSKDEKESNLREILNFGHTLGHAIEAEFHYTHYSHGEAIALGMLGATRMARALGYCDLHTLATLETLLEELGFDRHIHPCSVPALIDKLYSDKKVRHNAIRWIFPQEIGQVITTAEIPLTLIEQVIKDMMPHHA